MSSVIVDNSTLTAIQRLTGTAPVARSYSVQGDISVLENYLINLLFHDDVYYIDDYKPEFRDQREHYFKYCRRISPDNFEYDVFLQSARDVTDSILLQMSGGEIDEGLLRDFLESIGLHLTAAWHMQSSNFFLLLKVLGEGEYKEEYKYSPLTSLIYSQLTGQQITDPAISRCKLVSSDGEEISANQIKGGTEYTVDSHLLSFVRSLNWLTLRAGFYSMVSASFNAAVCMHPIRHNFWARWSSERSDIFKVSKSWRENLTSFFSENMTTAVNQINRSVESEVLGINLPVISTWAVGNAGNVEDAISLVLDLKQSPSAIKLRSFLNEIEECRISGEIRKYKTEVNRLKSAIEVETETLLTKHGASYLGQKTPSISFKADLAPVPSFGVEGTIEVDNWRLKYGKLSSVRTLFRNILGDVVSFDSLGDVRWKMLNQVKRSKDSTMPRLQVEPKKYWGRKTDWKIPM